MVASSFKNYHQILDTIDTIFKQVIILAMITGAWNAYVNFVWKCLWKIRGNRKEGGLWLWYIGRTRFDKWRNTSKRKRLIGKYSRSQDIPNRDQSISPKKGQLGVVDKSFMTNDDEGKRIAKVRMCEFGIPWYHASVCISRNNHFY